MPTFLCRPHWIRWTKIKWFLIGKIFYNTLSFKIFNVQKQCKISFPETFAFFEAFVRSSDVGYHRKDVRGCVPRSFQSYSDYLENFSERFIAMISGNDIELLVEYSDNEYVFS